jgi:hypothetical protein
VKASAESEAQIAGGDIKNQLTLVEIEVAKQAAAARRQRTKAELAEQEAIQAQYENTSSRDIRDELRRRQSFMVLITA